MEQAQTKVADHPQDPDGVIPDIDAAVRLAAYQLYEARGRVDGHDLEDWVEAQAIVARSASPTPPSPSA